ncbi:hypothetical protein P030_01130 [Anaplasma phagocytophilum str. CRT35]|nr:hypothetical protein P030_01130 [Anaplasma phagocytophilum str. CRT35]
MAYGFSMPYKSLLLDQGRTLFTLLRRLEFPTLPLMGRFVGRRKAARVAHRMESMLRKLIMVRTEVVKMK